MYQTNFVHSLHWNLKTSRNVKAGGEIGSREYGGRYLHSRKEVLFIEGGPGKGQRIWADLGVRVVQKPIPRAVKKKSQFICE